MTSKTNTSNHQITVRYFSDKDDWTCSIGKKKLWPATDADRVTLICQNQI